jgi:hypothetical protein
MMALGNLPCKTDANGSLIVSLDPSSVVKLNGTTTNDNAAAGIKGEYIVAQVLAGAPVSLVNATAKTVTSIALTAGDWDVVGIVDYTANGATVVTALQQGIGVAADTLGAQDTFTSADLGITGPSVDPAIVTPTVRVSLAAPATIYLIAQATFSVNTLVAYGSIRARRVR